MASRPGIEATGETRKRVRLQPHERERQILNAAIEFFAEVGPGGQTRELARRLGVTQSLIYRYFKDKEELTNSVYQRVFEGRWGPDWDMNLRDRQVDLRTRLVEFYTDYARVMHTREWVRIYLLAGFEHDEMPKRYRVHLRQRIFPVILEEVRYHFGVTAADHIAVGEENEMVTTLHGMFFYVGMRRWVYGVDTLIDSDEQFGRFIDMFLFGMADFYTRRVANRALKGQRGR